jgi:uncharacterized protein DUF6714
VAPQLRRTPLGCPIPFVDTQSLENRKKELATALRRAFGLEPLPSSEEIVTHQCEECELLRANFESIPWQELSEELIEKHRADLPLLSPKAFAYFIPAFIRYALKDLRRDSRVLDSLLYNLAPTEDDLPEWRRERLRYLTREQLDVIQEFLQLVTEQDELRIFQDLDSRRRRLESMWIERWNT